jgi:DNA polymerase III subunit beta
MRIKSNRELLLPLLAKAGGVVERRQTLPILGNILMIAYGDRVEVVGTDLELEIRVFANANVLKEGEITVPARKLIDICRALPEGADVDVNVDKEKAVLVSGKSKFILSTLPASNFPTMEGAEAIEYVEVEESILKELFDSTGFAMAQEDVRYYLNGLLLELGADAIVAVSTDGHRLAKVKKGVKVQLKKEGQLILPRKAVLELRRLLGNGSDDIAKLEISEKFFRACFQNIVVTSKLIDGKYPDYEKVIPSGSQRVAILDGDALKMALMRTAILSNEKYRGVRLSWDAGRLRLQAQNPEHEEAEDELEVEYSKEPTVMGFNVGYLIDVLNVLGKEVEIAFKDSDSSAVLRNRGEEDEIFVVMPMKL